MGRRCYLPGSIGERVESAAGLGTQSQPSALTQDTASEPLGQVPDLLALFQWSLPGCWGPSARSSLRRGACPSFPGQHLWCVLGSLFSSTAEELCPWAWPETSASLWKNGRLRLPGQVLVPGPPACGLAGALAFCQPWLSLAHSPSTRHGGVTTSVSRGGILTASWLSWPSLASDIKTFPCHRLPQKPVVQLTWPWLSPNVDVTRLTTGLALAPVGQAYEEHWSTVPSPHQTSARSP